MRQHQDRALQEQRGPVERDRAIAAGAVRPCRAARIDGDDRDERGDQADAGEHDLDDRSAARAAANASTSTPTSAAPKTISIGESSAVLDGGLGCRAASTGVIGAPSAVGDGRRVHGSVDADVLAGSRVDRRVDHVEHGFG